MSSELVSSLLSSSELSFQIFSASPFYAVSLNSALHHSSHVRSSQRTPPHLSLYHPFSEFLSSSQLFSAPCNSPHVFSSLLSSSHIFSALLTFSQMISALLSSCQLSSPHLSSLSDHLSSSLAQNMLQNRIPVPKPQKVGFCMKPLLHANLKGKYKASKKSIMKNSSAQL